MKKLERHSTRVEELKAMLAAYRRMSIDEVEAEEWGDQQIELEGELWRLEQEVRDRTRRPVRAA